VQKTLEQGRLNQSTKKALQPFLRFLLKLAQLAQLSTRKSIKQTKTLKIRSRDYFSKKQPPKELSSKNTKLNNFATVQLIFNNNKPINPVRQV
jgi:hypothetical protein